MEITNYIKEHKKIKDQIAETTEKLKKLNAKKELLEREMWDWWRCQDPDTRNQSYAAGQYGKVTFVTQRKFSIKDKQAFENWREDNGVHWNVVYKLQPQSANKFCRELLEEQGVLPKGVESYEYEQIRHSKS